MGRDVGRGRRAVLVLVGVAAEENARLIVVGAGERGELAGRLIWASPTWLPSARPATC
jgi:hypothetical protein